MTARITGAIRLVAHTCSDFGLYIMHLQSNCLKRGAPGGCEGGPTVAESRRDYRNMHNAATWFEHKVV